MTVTTDDTQITTLEQGRTVLEGSEEITFEAVGREQRYRWIEAVLKRFDYFRLRRKGKGLLKAYLRRLSGFSRAQLTRLVARGLKEGAIRQVQGCRNRFPAKYTDPDKELLAQTDNAHSRPSGSSRSRRSKSICAKWSAALPRHRNGA